MAPLTSKQRLLHIALICIFIPVEDAISRMVLETLNENQKGVHSRVSASLERFVLRTVQKIVDSPDFLSRFLDVVMVSPESIAPLAILVK